jgi:ketosteroid isomerase-like protein
MPKSAIEIVEALLKGATDPAVVDALVAPDATYVSLSFENPDLTRVMPWAGTHAGSGPQAILKTFQDVNRWWTVVAFEPTEVFSDGERVAVFGRFTLKSTTLGKQVTSPFSILAKVRDGQVIYMQYMEDTFLTSSSFRSGGAWQFSGNPDGSTATVG